MLAAYLTLFFGLVGQQPVADAGAFVYEKVSESVVLIIVEDDAGQVVGQGTAFLVEGGRLVTNAHVVRSGTPFVRAGAFKIACTVERIDLATDLALLTPIAPLTARPLRLASSSVQIGGTVFAIGNPQGFERTISSGLVTGERKIEGQSLLQISAPISPGSSGGPIVTAEGDVIGVAVASFRGGQNLNFAVPSSVLASFLSGSTTESVDALLAHAEGIRTEQKEVGYGEKWRELQTEKSATLGKALVLAADSLEEVLKVMRTAKDQVTDVWLDASRKAHSLSSSPTTEVLEHLSWSLRSHARWKEGPEERALLEEARTRATELSRRRTNGRDLRLLADIQEDLEETAAAYDSARRAVTLVEDKDDRLFLYRLLFRTGHKLGKAKEAEAWYQRIPAVDITDWDKASYADFLSKTDRHAEAGELLESLALGGDLFFRRPHELWCDAAFNYWVASFDDKALVAARECVAKATTVSGSESYVGQAHRIIGGILVRRSVFTSAVEHARQAIAVEQHFYAYELLAEGLNGLERYAEAEAAAKRAVELSDGGKYGPQFELGNAYFNQKKWGLAAGAYKAAAQLDPESDAATFNVGLSLRNDGFGAESIYWFEETLRRAPEHPKRALIQQLIRELKSGR